MKLEISAPIRPTEDETKVRAAVSTIFPKVSLERAGNQLIGSADGRETIETFRESIFNRRILDTVRQTLLFNLQTDHTYLLLNKQAAAAGKVALVGPAESPLGEIKADFWLDQAELNWLAPETANGRPIEPPADPKPLY